LSGKIAATSQLNFLTGFGVSQANCRAPTGLPAVRDNFSRRHTLDTQFGNRFAGIGGILRKFRGRAGIRGFPGVFVTSPAP